MHSGHPNANAAMPVNQETGTKTSTGIGTKAKGVVEVIQGAVDNFRGTMLDGTDTTKNDEFVQKGRAEVNRGLAKIKGNTQSHYGQFAPGGPQPYGSAQNPNPALAYPHQGQAGHVLPGQSTTHGPVATAQNYNANADLPQGPADGQYTYGTGSKVPPHKGTHQQQPGAGGGPTQGPRAGPGIMGAAAGHATDQVPPGQDPRVQPSGDNSGGNAQPGQPGQQTYPARHYHHRDDGISGIPHGEQDVQARVDDRTPPGENMNHNQVGAAQQHDESSGGPSLETTAAHRDLGPSGVPHGQQPKNDVHVPSRQDDVGGDSNQGVPAPAN